MKISIKLLALSSLLPSVALAVTDIIDLISLISRVISSLIPIVASLALLYFFWGLAQFIFASGNEVDSKKGKEMMFWGIIALFVMLSVWGLINLLSDTLDLENSPLPVPSLNESGLPGRPIGFPPAP